MGVRDLTAVAKRYAPDAISLHASIREFRGKRLAIDANLLTTKFHFANTAAREGPAQEEEGTPPTRDADELNGYRHARAWYHFLRRLDAHGIEPVVVFDGETRLEAKARETERRRRARDVQRLRSEAERRRGDRLREIRSVLAGVDDHERADFVASFGGAAKALLDERRREAEDRGASETDAPPSASGVPFAERLGAVERALADLELQRQEAGPAADGGHVAADQAAPPPLPSGALPSMPEPLEQSAAQATAAENVADRLAWGARPDDTHAPEAIPAVGADIDQPPAPKTQLPGSTTPIFDQGRGESQPSVGAASDPETAGPSPSSAAAATPAPAPAPASTSSVSALVSLFVAHLADSTNPIYSRNQLEVLRQEASFFSSLVDAAAEASPGTRGDEFGMVSHGPEGEDGSEPVGARAGADEGRVPAAAEAQTSFDPFETPSEPHETVGVDIEEDQGVAVAALHEDELPPLIERSRALERSHEQRSRAITPAAFAQVRTLIEALGVPWLQPSAADPHEAEGVCAALQHRGLVDYVVSEDTDVAAYGAPLLRNITLAERPKVPMNVLDPVKLRDALGLSREEFVDLAILLGTDFTERIRGFGPVTTLKSLRAHRNIEAVLEAEAVRFGLEPPFVEAYLETARVARDIFLNLPEVPSSIVERVTDFDADETDGLAEGRDERPPTAFLGTLVRTAPDPNLPALLAQYGISAWSLNDEEGFWVDEDRAFAYGWVDDVDDIGPSAPFEVADIEWEEELRSAAGLERSDQVRAVQGGGEDVVDVASEVDLLEGFDVDEQAALFTEVGQAPSRT